MAPQIPTLRFNELLKKLEKFDIHCFDGKGSEQKLMGLTCNSRERKIYTIGKHKKNREISRDLLRSILRRFEIDVEIFIDDAKH